MYLIFNSPKERDLFYEQIIQQPGTGVYTKHAGFVLCIEKKKRTIYYERVVNSLGK